MAFTAQVGTPDSRPGNLVPGLGARIPAQFLRVAVNREFPQVKHSIIVRDSHGIAIRRWAEDEARTENVMNGLSLSGVIPGGKKELKVNLPRDPRRYWPDIEGFLNIECQLPGRNRIWDGRIAKAPRSDGDRMVINDQAVGWAAALEDRLALRIGFIKSSLDGFGEPSAARTSALEKENFQPQATSTIGPAGTFATPAITQNLTRIVTNTTGPYAYAEMQYRSGVDLGALLFDAASIIGIAENVLWDTVAGLATDDLITAGDGKDFDGVGATQQTLAATAIGRRIALFQLVYRGTFAGDGNWTWAWSNIRLLSWLAAQNLTLQGTWPNVGYSAAQMLRVAIPAYSELTATADSVEDDGFIIEDAWFDDPGTLARGVDELVKYGLYDWFVKDKKLFELREPGTYGRRWQAYQGPSGFEEAGIDTDRCWDRIVVGYQDVDGSARYVGYPGSGCENEYAALQITDPDHPAVKAENPREDLLVLESVSTAARALEAGERWLQEANELSRSGKATLSNYVQDSAGVFWPVAVVAEGDLIRFPDSRDTSYRKIVEFDYDGDQRSNTVNLDAPSESVKALLARYRAVLVSRGFN